MEFRDLRTAARMRDLIERIASRVVDKKRPDVRIGHVHHVDSGQQLAWILYPGESEDSLVRVRVALNMLPTRTIENDGDQADIVRVAGRPGNYYIIDYMRGVPVSSGSEFTIAPSVATDYLAGDKTWQPVTNIMPTGSILMFGGAIPPLGWFRCDGTTKSRTIYADLFAVVGTVYGVGDGSTTFNLPDLRSKFPIGNSTAYSIGTTGGSEVHNHGGFTADKSLNQFTNTSDVDGGRQRLTGPDPHDHVITNSNHVPPYQAVNFIIKH